LLHIGAVLPIIEPRSLRGLNLSGSHKSAIPKHGSAKGITHQASKRWLNVFVMKNL
jgi:hypothetical protein